MSDERKEKIKNIREDITKGVYNFKKIESLIDKDIKNKSELKGFVVRAKNNFTFASKALDDFSNARFGSLGEQEFNAQLIPFSNIQTVAGTAAQIGNELQKRVNTTESLTDSGTAVAWTTSALASTISINIHNAQNLYPSKDSYVPKYKAQESIYENIEFIDGELTKINPDISRDFSEFNRKMTAHNSPESKNQELIGFRSTMFFKLIYAYAENNGIIAKDKGGTNTRFEQISYFATSKTTPPSIDISQIQLAKDLWYEMSNQSPSGDSVKLGIGTDPYLDGLLKRCISILASLLLLRKKYYT